MSHFAVALRNIDVGTKALEGLRRRSKQRFDLERSVQFGKPQIQKVAAASDATEEVEQD